MALFDLGEQRQRVVRRHQDDGSTGRERVHHPMDGCVSYRVRDLAGVEFGQGVVGCATSAGGVLFGDVEVGHGGDITTRGNG